MEPFLFSSCSCGVAFSRVPFLYIPTFPCVPCMSPACPDVSLICSWHVHSGSPCVLMCPQHAPIMCPVCPVCRCMSPARPQCACVSHCLAQVLRSLQALSEFLPWATFPQTPSCHVRVTARPLSTWRVSGEQTRPLLGKLCSGEATQSPVPSDDPVAASCAPGSHLHLGWVSWAGRLWGVGCGCGP